VLRMLGTAARLAIVLAHQVWMEVCCL